MNKDKNTYSEKLENKTEKHNTNKGRLFLNFLVSGLVVVAILTSIFSFALIGFSSPNHDKIEDKFQVDTSSGEIISEIVFDENLNKNVELIYGDRTFNFNDNYGQNIQNIVNELYVPANDAEVIFNPNSEEIFVFKEESDGQEVDVKALIDNIQFNLKQNNEAPIIIPTMAIKPNKTLNELNGLIELRSEFTTSIATSTENRKHNVKYALSAFNGLVVQPEEIISFNNITGLRTSANNYKDANIIMGGEYVLGAGGGVCQASTTLYNALICADLNILEVHNHSLPVSYVPLAFDAMVSDGGFDLIFQNTTEHPLYFLTTSNDKSVTVKIFGEPLEDGLQIKTRTEEVKKLPHKGDQIVADTEHKYQNKITFKGEYLRVKYPKAGSENIGYLQYYKNDELIEEKEIRHVFYPAQNGIIMEGTEELFEGMTLPENNIKFISPMTE